MSGCRKINNKMVCGMLHGGGVAHKDGIFRLAKGEKKYTPAQLKHLGKGKSKCGKKGKKCSCKK
jgi:hypothetical protein